MQMKVRLYLREGDEKFMGIGVLWLLKGVQKHGSLRQAALDMELSYTKALRMIDNLEKVLGLPVLNRKRGGADRSGASLTEFGQKFASLFEEFQNRADDQINGMFDEFQTRLTDLQKSQRSKEDNNG